MAKKMVKKMAKNRQNIKVEKRWKQMKRLLNQIMSLRNLYLKTIPTSDFCQKCLSESRPSKVFQWVKAVCLAKLSNKPKAWLKFWLVKTNLMFMSRILSSLCRILGTRPKCCKKTSSESVFEVLKYDS